MEDDTKFIHAFIAIALILAIWLSAEYFYLSGIKQKEIYGEVLSIYNHHLYRGGSLRWANVRADSGLKIKVLADISKCKTGELVKIAVYKPFPFTYKNYQVIHD